MRALNWQHNRSFASNPRNIAELANHDVHRTTAFAEQCVYARNLLGISLRNPALQPLPSEPPRNFTALAGTACPTVSARRCR